MRVSRVALKAAILLAVVLLGIWADAWAGEFNYSKFNQELGLRLAYGRSSRENIDLVSFLPRWGISLVRPGHTILGGLGLAFAVEGIVSVVSARNNGSEVGLTPLLQLNLPFSSRAFLFLEGGVGLIWQDIDSPITPNTFNFASQVGLGVDVALTYQVGVVLAYRFRHTSNAGIRQPNPAFDVHFFQAGLSYHY